MNLSCCVWSLPGPEAEVMSRVAKAGFSSIDVRPSALTSPIAHDIAGQLGLRVSCVAASFGLPDGASLESPDERASGQAMDYINQSLSEAAELGAKTAYIVPGKAEGGTYLDRLARNLSLAAEGASNSGIKLCVEHFPGSALPTVSETLAFLQGIGHPNLYLLFDTGHAQISGEEMVATIKAAGPHLGYVHLNDNDGLGDLHLPLLDGIMDRRALTRMLNALVDVGYSGPLSFELNQNLPDTDESLKRSREIVLNCEVGESNRREII